MVLNILITLLMKPCLYTSFYVCYQVHKLTVFFRCIAKQAFGHPTALFRDERVRQTALVHEVQTDVGPVFNYEISRARKVSSVSFPYYHPPPRPTTALVP